MSPTAGEPRAAEVSLGFALHGWFMRGLALSPGQVAIRIGRQELTYAQLHTRALLLAGNIAAICDGKPKAVGVLAAQTPECYVGILAALYAGAAVVPLNPGFPVERTAAMARAASVGAIVSDEPSAGILAELNERASGIPALLPAGPETPPAGLVASRTDSGLALTVPLPVRRDDVAYILFTSGSTGRPKGVQITHGNMDHFLRTNHERYQLTCDDVLSHTYDTTFDLAMFDLFMAWGVGARLVSTPPYAFKTLPEFVQTQGLTFWFSVPSAISLIRRMGGLTPGSMPTLRWSLFCGEPLTCRDAREWQSAAPNATVENVYGPTELTVACSAYRWSDAESPKHCVNDIVPIGHLYPGLYGLLLTADGIAGELCVTGPQMFPGYLDPADNEGRFIQRNGRRWYRTGDLVRETAGAGLAYLGRVDHQVKIRGYRVELPEIESVMRRMSGVHEAVAVAFTRGGGARELAAFYCGTELQPTDAIREMVQVLPRFMVPRWVWHLAELPLNSNRKIDRGALIKLAEQRVAEGAKPLLL